MTVTYDNNDLQSVALCAWKEARGEGHDGMRAVMHVILHRALRWYPHSEHPLHDSVYAKNQFTSMSVPCDPEFNLEPHPEDVQWQYCEALVPSIVAEQDADITHGALYYARLSEVTSGWFKENIVDNPAHPLKATIGHQVFYA